MTDPIFPDDEREDEQDDEQDAHDDDLDGDTAADDGAPSRKAVFVSTAVPVPLAVSALDDERAPEGSVLGSYIGDRLVARCAMPRETIERLLAMGLFDTPVPLALLAVEEEPGLQCRLFALVPTEKLQGMDDGGADEPWKSSVPSFEDRLAEDDEEEDDDDDEDDDDEDDESSEVASILLGHVVRFAGDRKFADDLTAEAVDVLQKIVLGGQLKDADSKAIDDLLGSL